MIANGQDYDLYPAFAENGAKSPPGGATESAKYANGFVPQDTFPAEWANYLFYGATSGITRLNADAFSMKKEINTVLYKNNIPNDANSYEQLWQALDKMKREAILAAHPVGSLYWTSKNENPAITFGGGSWTQIKEVFVKAKGDSEAVNSMGGTKEVVLTADNLPPHTHGIDGLAISDTNIGTKTAITNEYPDILWGCANKPSSDVSVFATIKETDDQSTFITISASVDYRNSSYNVYNRKPANIVARVVRDGQTVSNYLINSRNVGTYNNAQRADFVTVSDAVTIHDIIFNPYHFHNISVVVPIGSHTHSLSGSISANTTSRTPVTIMPPYVTKYCWERTA